MPYINVKIAKNLTTEQQSAIFSQTTSLMHEVMKKRREVTVVEITETSPGLWSVNGKPLNNNQPIAAYVDIKITENSNTEEEIAEIIFQTMEMLKQSVGLVQTACYVVVDQIPANAWGYDGITQESRARGA